jgi:nucleoside-diphosphate-sugar epimerase
MIKKIFITGASTPSGRAVVQRLKDNYPLTFLLPPGETASGISTKNIVRADITRARSMEGMLDGHDTVIHMASASGYRSWKDCLSINVDGSRNIIRNSVKAGVIRFIHLSSVAVYGRMPGSAITEDQPMKKIRDPSGDTMIDAEHIIRKMSEKHRIDLTVFRPAEPYGTGDEKFLTTLMERLRSGRFRMIGDGGNPVALVNTADVAEAVYLALLKPESAEQTYNLAADRNPSWNEFIEEVCRTMDIPFIPRHISYKSAFRQAILAEILSAFSNKPPGLNRYEVRLAGNSCAYSNRKAREELSFEPSVDPIGGVRDAVRKMQE